jgi:hypothetical protein
MANSFDFIHYFSKNLFLNKNNKVKNSQFCLRRRPREVHEIGYLPLAYGGGST